VFNVGCDYIERVDSGKMLEVHQSQVDQKSFLSGQLQLYEELKDPEGFASYGEGKLGYGQY